MGPAGADRLKEPVTDLLIDGEAGLKHRGGAAGIEDGADRRGDRGQVHQLDQRHVGADDVPQLRDLTSRVLMQDLNEPAITLCGGRGIDQRPAQAELAATV